MPQSGVCALVQVEGGQGSRLLPPCGDGKDRSVQGSSKWLGKGEKNKAEGESSQSHKEKLVLAWTKRGRDGLMRRTFLTKRTVHQDAPRERMAQHAICKDSRSSFTDLLSQLVGLAVILHSCKIYGVVPMIPRCPQLVTFLLVCLLTLCPPVELCATENLSSLYLNLCIPVVLVIAIESSFH